MRGMGGLGGDGMTDGDAVRRMTSIARALDVAGATDLSDRIETMLRMSQVSGSEFALTDPGGVQGLESTLRQKPVKPFIGDGFEREDDEDLNEKPKKPERPFRKKRTRPGGYEVGRDVALHHRPDVGVGKPVEIA